jgi:hypothetical protein
LGLLGQELLRLELLMPSLLLLGLMELLLLLEHHQLCNQRIL